MTHRPYAAAATITALFAIGAGCAGEPALEFVPEAADAPAPTVVADAEELGESVTSGPPASVVAGPVASGTTPPTRGTAVRVTDTLPPPPTAVATGLHGLPFAAVELSGCAEMEFYGDQAGLPAQFHWIGAGESDCRNTVSSWCCHGYFQVHGCWAEPGPGCWSGAWASSVSLKRCNVRGVADFLADTALAKQKNACMALLVFDEQGFCAWDVVTWC